MILGEKILVWRWKVQARTHFLQPRKYQGGLFTCIESTIADLRQLVLLLLALLVNFILLSGITRGKYSAITFKKLLLTLEKEIFTPQLPIPVPFCNKDFASI